MNRHVENFDKKAGLSGLSRGSKGYLADFPLRSKHRIYIALGLVAIYLVGITNTWWPTPDSSLYLTLARNMGQGNGYTFNGQVCNTVTPGFPAILMVLQWIAGENNYWAPQLFTVLCGLGTLWLSFLIFKNFTDKNTALLVTICTALSYTFYTGSHLILTDVPFAFMFWVTLWVTLRAIRGSLCWLLPVGLMVVVSLLIRAPGIVVIGPMALGLMLDKLPHVSRKRLLIIGATIGVIAVMTIGLMYLWGKQVKQNESLYASIAQDAGQAGAFVLLQRIGGSLWNLPSVFAEFLTGQKGFFYVGIPAFICAVIGGVIIWRRGWRTPIVIVVLCTLGLAIGGESIALRPRYAMPIQPLLVYLILEGLFWSVTQISERWKKPITPRTYHVVGIVFLILTTGISLPRVLRNAVYYSYASHTGQYYDVIRKGRHKWRFEMADFLTVRAAPSDRIAIPGNGSIIHYLTDLVTLHLPCDEKLTPEGVRETTKILQESPKVRFLLFSPCPGSPEFNQPMLESLKKLNFTMVYESGPWQLYQKIDTNPTP